MRKKVQKWKEEQKILSKLSKIIPITSKMMSLNCEYTPQKCSVILHRLVEKKKVKVHRFNFSSSIWYTKI